MKITIELNEAEVKGLKDYIKQSNEGQKVAKKDLQMEIQSIISGYMQSQNSALTSCIDKYRQNH